ncbi:ubiquitin-like protein 4, partial [Lecanoromycetidae sp. Uapishka_2]
MTELSFAKSFLSTLDSRPLKLQPDHVSNPKTLEITSSYVLPRMPNQFKKSSADSNVDNDAQKLSELNVTLKSSKNPVLSLSLPGTDVGTSVLSLKEKVAKELRIEGTDKIRVLYKKKPVGDVKTVKELVGEEDVGREMELGVMVMGYKEGESKADDTPMEDAEAPVAQGSSGEEVLSGEEFWSDLKQFLVQRIRDEGKATDIFDNFKETWEKKSKGQYIS